MFEEAKKYSVKEKFRLNSSGAYEYAKRNNLLDKICADMKQNRQTEDKSPSGKMPVPKKEWTHESVKEEALKYRRKTEFRKQCRSGYEYALKQGILQEVCAHTYPGIWNYDSALKEALKYKKRNQFKNGCRGAHSYAVKHGILDEICKHMAPPQKNGRERPANKVADESTSP